MGATPTSRHHNEENLEIKELQGMGNVLHTKTFIAEEDIICTYNGDCKGHIVTDRHEAVWSSRSPCTLVVKVEHHWVVCDVRDRLTGKSRSVGGKASDGINSLGKQTYWNARFEVDDNDPTLLVIKATRPIA